MPSWPMLDPPKSAADGSLPAVPILCSARRRRGRTAACWSSAGRQTSPYYSADSNSSSTGSAPLGRLVRHDQNTKIFVDFTGVVGVNDRRRVHLHDDRGTGDAIAGAQPGAVIDVDRSKASVEISAVLFDHRGGPLRA